MATAKYPLEQLAEMQAQMTVQTYHRMVSFGLISQERAREALLQSAASIECFPMGYLIAKHIRAAIDASVGGKPDLSPFDGEKQDNDGPDAASCCNKFKDTDASLSAG